MKAFAPLNTADKLVAAAGAFFTSVALMGGVALLAYHQETHANMLTGQPSQAHMVVTPDGCTKVVESMTRA